MPPSPLAASTSLTDTILALLKERKVTSAFSVYITLISRDMDQTPCFFMGPEEHRRYAAFAETVQQTLNDLTNQQRVQRLYAEGALPHLRSMVLTYYLYLDDHQRL